MVIHAYIGTNVRDVVRDAVDQLHRVSYKGNRVTLKDNFGRDDFLQVSTGVLRLGEVQVPERPVLRALVGDYDFRDDGVCMPVMVPGKGELYLFPALFELERVACGPVVIAGIDRLCSDGGGVFGPEDLYWQEQAGRLEAFTEVYAQGRDKTTLARPVLEGFFEAMREGNERYLEKVAETGDSRRQRVFRGMVASEQDFRGVFGRWYEALRERRGAPRFD